MRVSGCRDESRVRVPISAMTGRPAMVNGGTISFMVEPVNTILTALDTPGSILRVASGVRARLCGKMAHLMMETSMKIRWRVLVPSYGRQERSTVVSGEAV